MNSTAIRQDIVGDVSSAIGNNEALLTLWNTWNAMFEASGSIPDRAAMTMQKLKSILQLLVVCERCDDGAIRVRLSGTRVDELLGPGLKGRNILELSPPQQRANIDRIYSNICDVPCGFLIHETLLLRGEQNTWLDALLLPLRDTSGALRFFIGCYAFGSNRFELGPLDKAPIVHRAVDSFGYVDLGNGVPLT